MKNVILIFPDTTAMADFIINQQVGNAEVNSLEQTLTAVIEDDEILIAETRYGASLKTILVDHLSISQGHCIWPPIG